MRAWSIHRAVYICAGVQNDEKQAALEAAGATVLMLPGADGRVDLAAMVRELARREINEIHVEAGQTLNGALIQAGVVDELLLYLAPKLLGPGMDMANLPALAHLDQALELDITSVSQVGPDIRIAGRIKGRDQF
jgi:diaminohydroxyphosphoribosylaminopyrimidine deaminase/5-amino-6-(5-phosphoribosylamino)uracil reductase